MEMTNNELHKELVLQAAEAIDYMRVDDKQTEEEILKELLIRLCHFCADRNISFSDSLRVVTVQFAHDLVEQVPHMIEKDGHEYILSIQVLKGRWQAAYRWQLVTLDNIVGEGDTLYLAIELLKDELAELQSAYLPGCIHP